MCAWEGEGGWVGRRRKPVGWPRKVFLEKEEGLERGEGRGKSLFRRKWRKKVA